MKKTNKNLGILLTACTLGLCLTSIGANADVSVRSLPPAGVVANATAPTPQVNVTVAPPPLDAFEAQRLSLHATHVDGLAQIQENFSALQGTVLEMEGQVLGILSQNSQKIVLLKLDHDTVSLQIPLSFENSTLLSPASLVRVLVNVQAPMQFTLIAAAPPSQQTALAKIPDSSAVVLPPMAGTISALPAPPAENIFSYQSSAQTAPTANATNSSVSNSSPSTNADAVVAQQKAAYSQMIQSTNSKLKPSVADEIAEAILRAGLKYQMDPRFLAAIIGVESDYDTACLSNSGAMGLGQLMPFNLKEAGVVDPWNPTQNIFGTAKLIRGHLNDYKNRPNGTLLAVAAYNAGPGAVRRAGFQVPDAPQVRRYVWKVYYRYKALAPDMF